MDTATTKGNKATVLIVDDSPDTLTMLSGLLKDHYRIKIASKGEQALAIAASMPPPDLILLDIMMPEIDGYEVCTKLKADTQTKNIPVIFLTAKTDVADEQHGFSLGAVDYITKPISPPHSPGQGTHPSQSQSRLRSPHPPAQISGRHGEHDCP